MRCLGFTYPFLKESFALLIQTLLLNSEPHFCSSTTLTTSAIEMYCKISSKSVCVSEFSLKYHIYIQLLEEYVNV